MKEDEGGWRGMEEGRGGVDEGGAGVEDKWKKKKIFEKKNCFYKVPTL